ncbi:TIGR01458 family HAD-type hydrolase [Nitratifractor salsuginis]|uniref:Haloacid dehalogenase-like hydrolase domain-containing protein 2 n=1 Tax=Nitratifractor salsuginis (strain DSM 16511 / JCM 12458 / E9I37-1) TaxID=749222 RepID=E6X2C3_NITSE|nr:TIGR01458 family HAD-type hydrolase [Nitratifractor salsuginis]ADV46058.1 HAD-superfamily subfamily IIA hydrolase like protein [Nitratifractor salsuginis DSM 16511]
MKNVKGILMDIGGVLYVGETPVAGAVEAVAKLRERYALCFVTNTTRRSPESVRQKLLKMGFAITPEQLFTALAAARRIVEEAEGRAVTILTEEAERYFGELCSIDTVSHFVVVGDAGENFTFARMNRGFRALIRGARLIAAARNRYFKDADGELSLDAGGFVKALEYAAGTEATVVGKPSWEFFHQALKSMGVRPEEAIMVGDDIESDIAGAQAAGIRAVMVRTGKFRPADLEGAIFPDAVIDSVAELPELLE